MCDKELTLGAVDQPAPPDAKRARGDPNLGRRVGPYRIERRLAGGGMGIVYLAVREDDFEQRVALKLVRPKLGTVEVLRRFYEERQILARLQHPSIARILDGGTTGDALPFFAMEYVEGEPIDRYCENHGLALARRLELFREVCAAVHFAHQNLVVHRDLKPGNILVTPEGVPKLLDFGIAEILGAAPEAADAPGEHPMTPDYASPEQILGQPVTTASDVYSLGVLLYRLVSDRSPYHMAGLDAQRRAERIRGSEPKPPSAAVDRPLARRLAGELDAIVQKAMHKEPGRRYASALQLAEDLRRHLADLPVEAFAGSWFYRARKLARRHRWAVAVAWLVVVFALTATVLWRQAVHQRAQAERAQLRAEKVSTFLADLFRSADPDMARGESLTVREVLDRSREKLAGELAQEPEIRAELLTTLGTVYNNLALYREARELKQAALHSRLAADPGDRPDLAADLNNLGRLDYDLGSYAAAEERFREALAMWQRLGDEAGVVVALRNLAAVLMQRGETAQALELHARVLEIQRRLYGSEDPEVAATLYSLGALHRIRGEPEKAEPILRRALGIYSQSFGPRHTRIAAVESSLGRVLYALGRLPEAREHHERALGIRRELLGDDHVEVANSGKHLAAVLLAQGEAEAAGQLLETALDVLRRKRPEGDWMIADAGGVWGSYLAARGRSAEAEPHLLAGYHTLREVKGKDHADTREALRRLNLLYEARGKQEPATR